MQHRLLHRLRHILLLLLALLARPFVRPTRAEAPQRILVIKPDHLGDVLLATPALSALRQSLPEARVTVLVGPWGRAALATNPDIDALQTLPFPGFERQTKGGGFVVFTQPYITLLRYALLLRRTRYDAALVLRDDHWWGAALAMLAGIPRRVGYAVPECRPFLSDALPWNPDEHVTAQGLRLVEQLVDTSSEEISAQSASFLVAWDDAAWADTWLSANGLSARKIVVIHPGTGGRSKLWIPDRWSTLADNLVDINNYAIVLTGGPGEGALVEEVASGMRNVPRTLVGETSVGQLAALLARAALVIGVDSGPLHLAAAVGAPSLHLYGPGDHRRFGPWGDAARHVVLRAGLWCSPCGVFSACPRGTAPSECMERIAVAPVLAAVRQLLG